MATEPPSTSSGEPEPRGITWTPDFVRGSKPLTRNGDPDKIGYTLRTTGRIFGSGTSRGASGGSEMREGVGFHISLFYFII
jgi:hypothetical protein